MSRFVRGPLALGLLGWVLLLSGCTGSEAPRSPPSAGRTTAPVRESAPREQRLAGPPIRIAMSAAFVSESGIGVYSQLADWLARQLGRQVDFVSGFSYGTIDVLAAPVVKAPRFRAQPIYISNLIVKMAPELRRRLGFALTHMHEDAEGRRILDAAQISRFVPVEDAHYDGIRRRHALAQRTGFLDLR